MGEIVSGVNVMTEFCKPMSHVFKNYIDYIDRIEAKRNEMLSAYNLYNDYMDNPEKTTGLFTKNKLNLKPEEKMALKDVFTTARDNGSLMWQTVISFDNRWLEKYGVYDSKTNILDENKLKEVATGVVNKMLANEHLENAVWSAAIHYNTDNIHVHVATVEPVPMRQQKEYTVYTTEKKDGKDIKVPLRNDKGEIVKRLEYVGRFKGRSIELCKKHVVDEIMGQREQNIEINRILREQIVKQKKENLLATDVDLKDKFLAIYKCLPRTGNRGLWKYNVSAMSKVRPMLDDLSKAYINKYHMEDYKTFIKLLNEQSKDYKTAYGMNGKRNFKDSKIKELYERLGNQILKEMRDYDVRTGGAEYDEKEVDRIMEEYLEQMQEEREAETEVDTEIDDDLFIDLSEFDINNTIMDWSDNYKQARKLLYSRNKDLKRGLEIMTKEVENGNVLAIFEMGNIYQKGIGVETDNEKADYHFQYSLNGFLYLYENGENGEHEEMMPYYAYRIGKQYHHGLGTEKDYEKAFTYLKISADAENPYASYYVGNMYYNGNGVEVNKNEAIEYYMKASIRKGSARRGNPYADYKLGMIYEQGDIVNKNLDEANNYYMVAYDKFLQMELKNPDANIEYKLGMMNLKGKGVEEDKEMAESFFKLSAENGNSYAQYQYAKILLDKGDFENAQKAIRMLSYSAEKNNSMAQYQLGKLYATDERFKDIERAIHFLSLSSVNNESAMYQLGKLYEDKTSKFYNLEKAIKCFSDVAAKGNEFAQYKLGKIYSDKNSEFYDIKSAVHFLTLASDKENKFAQYKLGNIYANRESGVYDTKKAILYLSDVADKGNEFAQYKLAKVYMDNEADTYNPLKAVHYYEMASEQGNEYADIALGFIYMNGNGIRSDRAQARRYFEKASLSGNDFATQVLKSMEVHSQQQRANRLGRLAMKIQNRGAYDVERALRGLKKSFETAFEKERAIRLHEQLLEQERKEQEREEREENTEEIEH